MNGYELIKAFLKENYGDAYKIHNKHNDFTLAWFSFKPEFYVEDDTSYQMTLSVLSNKVEIWNFPYHYTVVGHLAGILNIADPDLFQKVTEIISRKIKLEPLCQHLKTKT